MYPFNGTNIIFVHLHCHAMNDTAKGHLLFNTIASIILAASYCVRALGQI